MTAPDEKILLNSESVDGVVIVFAKVVVDAINGNTLEYIQLKVGDNPPVSLAPATFDALNVMFADMETRLTALGIVLTPP